MVLELEVMECTQVHVLVAATTLSMHERFTRLAEIKPFQSARRISTHDGPLLGDHLLAMQTQPQQIVDAVVQQLGLGLLVQKLQQCNRSRAGSRPRSRAGSVSSYGSKNEMPPLVRSNSWGNLSQANSVGNVSQRSGQSGRSHGGQNNRSRSMSFVGPDLNLRLQMRNAWMRRMRARARGPRNYIQRNQYQQRSRWQPYNQPRRPWQGWQPARQQWWRQGVVKSRLGWDRQQPSVAQSDMPPLTPRGRAGQEISGVRQNDMPALKTKEELDKELDEYMASSPAMLDKQLEDYLRGAERA